MSETPTYQAGSEVQIGDATIVITSRKGSHGIRYSWFDRAADIGGEGYKATPELAVADATKTLNAPTCRHGWPVTKFCPSCHDTEI